MSIAVSFAITIFTVFRTHKTKKELVLYSWISNKYHSTIEKESKTDKKGEALSILFDLQRDCPKEDYELLCRINALINQVKQYSGFFAVSTLKKSTYQPNYDLQTSKSIWSCIDMLQSLVKESILKHSLSVVVPPLLPASLDKVEQRKEDLLEV
jgi:hypothetical protein